MGAFERILNRDDGFSKGSRQWQEQYQGTPAVSARTPDKNRGQAETFPKGTKEWNGQQQDAGGVISDRDAGGSIPEQQSAKESNPEQDAGGVISDRDAGGGIPNSPSSQVQREEIPKRLETPAPMTMAQLYEKLNGANKPLTDEQLEAQRKKERRDKMIAAIGDGISAISNLVFTTQYAPDMYEGKNSMSERMRVRYDKLNKEREAREKEYNIGLYNAMKYDAELALQKERDRREAAKAERDAQLFKLELDLKNKEISAAEAEVRRKQIEANFANELEAAKVQTEKERGKKYAADASASKARANYYNNGGSGGIKGSGGKRMSLTIDGKKMFFDTKEDYERAVMRYAKEYGIDTTEDSEKTTEETTTGGSGRLWNANRTKSTRSSSKKARDISKVAADVERASELRTHKKKGDGLGWGKNKNQQETDW